MTRLSWLPVYTQGSLICLALITTRVVSYIDVLSNKVKIGGSVAIIGAGGIGFDVAEYLSHLDDHGTGQSSDPLQAFTDEWGIDRSLKARGGVEGVKAKAPKSPREVWLVTTQSWQAGVKRWVRRRVGYTV